MYTIDIRDQVTILLESARQCHSDILKEHKDIYWNGFQLLQAAIDVGW